MRLVPTSRILDGAELGRDVIARADGIPLLRAGVRITSQYRERLLAAGIHAVYVEDGPSAGIQPEQIISAETREHATRAVAHAYGSARDAVARGGPMNDDAVQGLAAVVQRILAEIDQSGQVALALADLAGADAYTLQHSIDVAALGLLLGQRLFRERGWVDYEGVRRFTRIDERLSQLGTGLLLHDIGKLAVPTEILNKPGRLTAAEWELIKAHPRTGIELLGDGAWSPLVKSVVLRHHERWDGSGYPDGKFGEQIHEMARIAAVADVYDAITSQRPYAPARPAHEGVRAILAGRGTMFDADVVDVFARLVAPFPPGDELTLVDGRRGVVVSVPERAPDRPLVRVLDCPDGPYELSLLADPTLRIAGWEPEPVTLAA